jgi:hypothetical protein
MGNSGSRSDADNHRRRVGRGGLPRVCFEVRIRPLRMILTEDLARAGDDEPAARLHARSKDLQHEDHAGRSGVRGEAGRGGGSPATAVSAAFPRCWSSRTGAVAVQQRGDGCAVDVADFHEIALGDRRRCHGRPRSREPGKVVGCLVAEVMEVTAGDRNLRRTSGRSIPFRYARGAPLEGARSPETTGRPCGRLEIRQSYGRSS